MNINIKEIEQIKDELHSMKENIAIIDERLFSKIFGLDESNLYSQNCNDMIESILAKDYLQKAAKLISAARQDIFVLGKYNEDYHNEVDMDNVIPYSKDTEEFYNGVY